MIRLDVGGLDDDGRDDGGGGGLEDGSVFGEAMAFGDEIGVDTTAELDDGGRLEASAALSKRRRRAAFTRHAGHSGLGMSNCRCRE